MESAGNEIGRKIGGFLTLIWFSLLSEFSGGLDSALAAVLFQIFVRHYFTTNKLVLEVRTGQMSEGARSNDKLEAYWMTPAAWGALVPFRIVHALTSSGPQVKYRISFEKESDPRCAIAGLHPQLNYCNRLG